ncbi:MAG: CD225/dispanin family protein [Akkermansia sp.]|nr:CD225/dispanin family protein [Akkermansia sp.]
METTNQYYLAKPGQSEPMGPFCLAALQSMAKAGVLSADYLYAVDGMSAWKPLAELKGIGSLKTVYKGARPASHLVLSLLLTFCCCPVTALVAVVYALQVDKKYDAGDIVGARRAADCAATWCIVTLIVGIVFWLCSFSLG